MKNYLLVFILLSAGLFTPIFCAAQIFIGIKGGASLVNVRYDFEREFHTDFVPSYHIGGELNYQFNEKLWLGLDILFNRKGYHYEDAHGFDYTIRSTILPHSDSVYYAGIKDARFLSLQIPLFVTYRFGNLFAEAGLYGAIIFSGKHTYWNDNSYKTDFGNDRMTRAYAVPLFSRFDYGWQGGVGYMFLKEKLRLSAVYEQGIANVLPKFSPPDKDYTAHHQALRLSLAYYFPNIILRKK